MLSIIGRHAIHVGQSDRSAMPGGRGGGRSIQHHGFPIPPANDSLPSRSAPAQLAKPPHVSANSLLNPSPPTRRVKRSPESNLAPRDVRLAPRDVSSATSPLPHPPPPLTPVQRSWVVPPWSGWSFSRRPLTARDILWVVSAVAHHRRPFPQCSSRTGWRLCENGKQHC